MNRAVALAVVGFLSLCGLTGCFSSVRKVARVQVAGAYKTATVDQLEAEISQRDAAIRTLNASVLLTYSTGGSREGRVKTYTSFRGYIFVRKPRDLRVILQLPVIGGEAMDMVSDSGSFTLLVPPKKEAFTGSDEVTKPSPNAVQNFRPAVFFDSLLVPGVASDEYVTLTQSAREVEPAHGRKPAVDEPDYDFAVYKTSSDHLLQVERVIHISRVTMLPYQQDIYNKDGELVTQATYADYQPVGAEEQFARLVTITRPAEEYSLKIQVTKLTLNQGFENDQFALKVPASYKLTRLQ